MRTFAHFLPMFENPRSQRFDIARIVIVIVDEARLGQPSPSPQHVGYRSNTEPVVDEQYCGYKGSTSRRPIFCPARECMACATLGLP